MMAKMRRKRTRRGNGAVVGGGKIGGVPVAVSAVNYSPKRSKMKRKTLVTLKMKMTPSKASSFLSGLRRSMR